MRIALWIRLGVIAAFAVFVAVQEIWWLTALCAVFAVITAYQLHRSH